jgi:hypothetical protein
VRPHRYGSYLVAVHSCVEVLNDTSLPLQLGALSPFGLEPSPFALLAPGGHAWLPLPLATATTPSLCLRPAPAAAPSPSVSAAPTASASLPAAPDRSLGSGASISHPPEGDADAPAAAGAAHPPHATRPPQASAHAHGWSRPVDVGALLVPSGDAAASRAAFWYCPPAHAAPRIVVFPPAGAAGAVLGGGGSNSSSYGDLHHHLPLAEGVAGGSGGAPHGHAPPHSLLRARTAHGSAGAFSAVASSGGASETGSQPPTPHVGGPRGGSAGPAAAAALPLMVCLGAAPLPLPSPLRGGGQAPAGGGAATAPPAASPSRPSRDAGPAPSGPSQSPGARAGSWAPGPGAPGGPPRLWRLRVSPPLVLTNELPVPLEAALGAGGRGAGGFGEARVAEATVLPGRKLMLYDLEPHLYHRLQVTPLGFNPTPWISLPAAAAAGVHGGPEGGVGAAAAGGGEEREGGRSVVVAPTQLDQPSELIQVGWAAAPGSGALSLTVSCGLWVFNHTGMPLGLRQVPAPGAAAAPAPAEPQPSDAAALLAATPPRAPVLGPRALTPLTASGGLSSSPTGAALPAPAAHLLPTAAAMAAASIAGDGGSGASLPGRRRVLDLRNPPVLWVAPQPPPGAASEASRGDGRRLRGGRECPAAEAARIVGSVSARAASPGTRGSSARVGPTISIAPPPSPATVAGTGLGAGGLASLASAPSAGLPSPAPSVASALMLPGGLAPNASGRREPAAAAAAAAAAAVAPRPPGGLQRRSRSLGSMTPGAPGGDAGADAAAVQAAAAPGSRAHLRLTFTDHDSPSGGVASPQTPVWGVAGEGGPTARALPQRAPSVVSQDGSLVAASVVSAPPGVGGSLSSLRTRRPAAAAAAARHPWPSLLGLPARPAAPAPAAPPLELQLCAAPAAAAAAAARGIPSAGSGRPLSVPAPCWSAPVALPLRRLPGGPPTTAAVVKLPYPAPAPPAVVAAGGAAAQAGAATQGVAFVSLQLRDLPHAGGGGDGEAGSGSGREARALHILPTYQLLNLLPFEVQLRQAGTEQALQVGWLPWAAEGGAWLPAPQRPWRAAVGWLQAAGAHAERCLSPARPPTAGRAAQRRALRRAVGRRAAAAEAAVPRRRARLVLVRRRCA